MNGELRKKNKRKRKLKLLTTSAGRRVPNGRRLVVAGRQQQVRPARFRVPGQAVDGTVVRAWNLLGSTKRRKLGTTR